MRDSVEHPAGGHVGLGQVLAGPERLGMVRAQLDLLQLERRLEQDDRLGQPAGPVIVDGQVLRLRSVSGWSWPSFASRSLSVASCIAIASGNWPASP